MKEIGPTFQDRTGDTLSVRLGLNPAQLEALSSRKYDVAIVTSPVANQAVQKGFVDQTSLHPIAAARLGLGVHEGRPVRDISSVESYKAAILELKSISLVEKESAGETVLDGFDKLGIAEAVRPKLNFAKTTSEVWQKVSAGEIEAGMGFISNVLAAPNVRFVGPLPAELQYAITLIAVVRSPDQEDSGARELVKFLQDQRIADVLRSKGLEPVN